MESVIDFYGNLIRYNGNIIIIIMDQHANPWFHGNETLHILGYGKKSNMLIRYVDESEKKKYEEIKKYGNGKYGIQDHTIFISESALLIN